MAKNSKVKLNVVVEKQTGELAEGKIKLTLNGHDLITSVSEADLSLARVGGEDGLRKHISAIAKKKHQDILVEIKGNIKATQEALDAIDTSFAAQITAAKSIGREEAQKDLKSNMLPKVEGIRKAFADFLNSDVNTSAVITECDVSNEAVVTVSYDVKVTDIDRGEVLYKRSGKREVTLEDEQVFVALTNNRAQAKDAKAKLENLKNDFIETSAAAYHIPVSVDAYVAQVMLRTSGTGDIIHKQATTSPDIDISI